MSTAGYLQDAKNQQKRLAETITTKGITATATEKYKSLVDKVAQIENLKGEERTLENFTNVLSEPKSIVQLEYPDNTPKTLNAKLGSKNLIPYPYTDTTKTLNGITFTVNSDGSVTVSGTATAQAYFKLQQSFSLKEGQYFFSGCPKGGAGTTYSLYLSTSDYAFYKADIGNGISINAENDKTVLITINIANGTTVDNLVFKPQLELGSTATSYTPYISDLTSVTVTRYGKNLFDKNNANIIAGYINANVITAASTSRCIYIPCNPNTTYTVSKIATARFVVAFTNVIPTAGTAVTNRVQNFTATSITATSGADSKYIVVWLYNSAYDTTTTIDEILATVQIELGSTATTYEPYQGQTYTPTVSGEVTGITNLYPVTTLLTNNAGVVFEQITGGFYKEILPSTDKNGITKVYQPSVDNTIDSNIKPENIKKGVKILGILGTYDGN
jgi:hypothetical protein